MKKRVKGASSVISAESEEYRILTEGQLRWRKFLKHRVAVVAAVILIIFYITAIFAEFFAPYSPLTQFDEYTYVSPQIGKIRFVDDEGRERKGEKGSRRGCGEIEKSVKLNKRMVR